MVTILVINLLQLLAFFSPSDTTPPVVVSKVASYECESLHGHTTMSAKNTFTQFSATCPLKDGKFAPDELVKLSDILTKATVRKHHQMKYGQNNRFLVMTINNQPANILLTPNLFFIDLSAMKIYTVTDSLDRVWLESLMNAL